MIKAKSTASVNALCSSINKREMLGVQILWQTTHQDGGVDIFWHFFIHMEPHSHEISVHFCEINSVLADKLLTKIKLNWSRFLAKNGNLVLRYILIWFYETIQPPYYYPIVYNSEWQWAKTRQRLPKLCSALRPGSAHWETSRDRPQPAQWPSCLLQLLSKE